MGGHSTIELLCLTSTKQYLSASAVGGHRVISTSAPSPGRCRQAKMRHTLALIVAILVALVSSGQEIKRQDNETIEAFIERVIPDSTSLAHPAIETKTWNAANKTIIAFYGYDDKSDINTGYNKIFGHLYLPTGENYYRDISFGPILEDGGYPEIISVFFENADKDKDKELVVLCKYEQRHYDYNGAFYETFIFDNPQQKSQLYYFEKLSGEFWGCQCTWRNGKSETAKYKTVKDIKAKLRLISSK
jgi:hypothetical protein